MATSENPKNPSLYKCENCNYNTSSKKDYNKHIYTKKHIRNTSATFSNNLATTKSLKCEFCGKSYKDRTGLWRHKKICSPSEDIYPQHEEFKFNGMDKDDLIIMLLKQNAELIKGQQNITMEVVKNGTNNNNTILTNSHNKAFNLQFFLNETCKNAMNITDFVESIKLQLSDFMNMGEIGFVENISNIIVKNLNSLDETIRPIHCTDQKRETFYVKDKNQWEKEDDDKKKMKDMIRSISYKNEKLIKTYKETYPDYNDSESRRSDQYSKIMIEAMDCKAESREKIIKNISKAAVIGKSL